MPAKEKAFVLQELTGSKEDLTAVGKRVAAARKER